MKPFHLIVKAKPLLLSLLITLGVGALSGFITGGSVMRYQELVLPWFAPPGIVFPIVWTVLYVLMAFSAYLVMTSEAALDEKKMALGLYLAQLVVNGSWSIVFFRFGQLNLAFWVIVLLVFLLSCTMGAFRTISKTAAWLLLPYLLWCLFALVLNYAIAVLN